MKRLKLYLCLVVTVWAGSLLVMGGEAAGRTNASPVFDGQLVFLYGHPARVTSTVALLNLASATNRFELPGGTNEFYVVFDGHHRGKDVYTIGTKFPVGGPHEVSTVKRVEYAGKRVRYSLDEEAAVVLEPRKAAK